jgi:hypothetical protein
MTTIDVCWPCSRTCGHERAEVCAAFAIQESKSCVCELGRANDLVLRSGSDPGPRIVREF